MAVLQRHKSTIFGLVTDLTTLQNNIDIEASARIAGDTTLQANIDAEITARIAGDAANSSAVDAETSARIAADTTLQANIDAESSARIAADTTLTNNLNAEITARTDADTTLTNNLNAEITARTDGDTALGVRIDNVNSGTGLVADAYVANGLANYISLATSLADADNKLDTQVKANADAILAETTARTDADTVLTNNLNAEITARTDGDAAIQSELDATQSGAGLGVGGAYIADAGTNYITGATTLMDADVLLDAAIKQNDDDIASLDAATLKKASNLSDLLDPAAARTNLGVYSTSEVDAAISAAELNLGTNFSVADLTARDALAAGTLSIGDNVFVTDDGDTKWAIYKVTAITDGAGSTSTYEKIMDEDVYLNAISASAIKASYESNADTNAFTDEALARSNRIGASGTTLTTTAQDILAAINELDANHDAQQSEIDDTQIGAGLNTDGSYIVDAGSNYLTAAVSLADADDKLDAAIKVNELAIAAETTARTNADTTLQANIDAETTARQAADTTLQANIDAETSARIAADTTLTNNLNAEITRATDAETVLTNNLNAEITARGDADTVITNNLNAEITRATDAEAAIQAELDATQAGAGLGTDGTYTANGSSNYLTTATSLTDADNKLDIALKALDDDTYSIAEVDAAIAAGGAIFITESKVVSSDQIVLTHAPKNGVIFNFATVRHTDANFVSYDIPVTVEASDSTGKTFNLSPDASGDFDTKTVVVQYAYVPAV